MAGFCVELKKAWLATRDPSIDFIAHWCRGSDQAHPSRRGWDFFFVRKKNPTAEFILEFNADCFYLFMRANEYQ
jgi:hypothetical protein